MLGFGWSALNHNLAIIWDRLTFNSKTFWQGGNNPQSTFFILFGEFSLVFIRFLSLICLTILISVEYFMPYKAQTEFSNTFWLLKPGFAIWEKVLLQKRETDAFQTPFRWRNGWRLDPNLLPNGKTRFQ